jgi:small nuclear ribonucleoprotein (snRNP)-like protein
VEGVIKECSQYRGLWSTQLQNVQQIGKGQASAYLGKPGEIITERVKILAVTDATYGGKAVRMETPNRRILVAYDQHSNLQLANVGEVWDITAKVKKHGMGVTQIYYISKAAKV